MAGSKKHHYVPRFLLRYFSDEGEQIYVFDKTNGLVFRSNIINVAAENRLYQFSIDGRAATIEPGLAEFETKAADALRKTLAAQSLAKITIFDRTVLAAFVAQLLLRSPNRQAMVDDMISQLREKIRAMGMDPDRVPQLKRFDANERKIFTVGLLTEVWRELIPVIAFKTWVLHQLPQDEPLYLSDNPLVMHNDIQFELRGNLGLAVKGVELYLPLSPTACLAMYCPEITAELEENYEKLRRSGQPCTPDRRESLEKLFTAFHTGEPSTFDPSNVEFVNSLQVWNAERYVYAARDDFKLARAMLAKNPRLRFGPRSSIR